MENELKEIQKRIRETEKGLKSIHRNLKWISEHPGDVYGIQPHLDSIGVLIEKTEFDRKGVLEIVDRLKNKTQRLKEDFRFELSKGLEQMLLKNGMELHGQLPDLYTGFYRIKIDFINGKADILFGPEKITRCPISPEEIIKRLKRLDEELKKNSIPEEELLKRLFYSWRRASSLLKSERILLTTILTELTILLQKRQFYENPLRRNYTEYPRYRFAYDIYRLQKKGVRKSEGKELQLIASTFDATRKKIDHLWIPTNHRGDGVNYSYLLFKSV